MDQGIVVALAYTRERMIESVTVNDSVLSVAAMHLDPTPRLPNFFMQGKSFLLARRAGLWKNSKKQWKT